MKLRYPYPIMFESDSTEMMKYSHSLAMLALTPQNDLVIVEEFRYPSVWRSFWMQAESRSLNIIDIQKGNDGDPTSISNVAMHIINGLNYITYQGYLFIGLLHFDSNVFDPQICETKGLFKPKKLRKFMDMLPKYHEMQRYPELKDKSFIDIQFEGQGDKFFDLNLVQFSQIAKMSTYFRGSLIGIAGLPENEKFIEFVILSQNITREKTLPDLILNKKGRDNLRNLIKLHKFIPFGSFKIDYGYAALKMLPEWGSIKILTQYIIPISEYRKYLKIIASGKMVSKPKIALPPPYHLETLKILEEELQKSKIQKTLSIEEILNEETTEQKEFQKPLIQGDSTIEAKSIDSLPKREIHTEIQSLSEDNKEDKNIALEIQSPSVNNLEPINLSSKLTLEKPTLPEIKSDDQKIKTINLELPNLEKVSSQKPNIFEENKEISISEEDEYEDIFNPIQDEDHFFDESGKAVFDPNDIESVLSASSFLENDLGNAINPTLMTQENIFKDLEKSLEAMSKLDDLAEKDAAITRIYYPPPTLLSYANKEGMQIGGSSCLLSMGVGRNLWMIPELKRIQMWGEFWKQDEVEGNPQIKDFIAMDEKDIESAEEFENILQKAFIRIRRNNQIFIGLAQFEGNGFERNVFEECKLPEEKIQKLQTIHNDRRIKTKFPEISSESWIEMRYYGQSDVINLISDPNSQSSLDIIEDITKSHYFNNGFISGIICVDEEAAYFYILTHDFNKDRKEDQNYPIDEQTLQRMFDMINSANLTPVSWCKLSFGFEGLNHLDFWEDIKDGTIMELIEEKYNKYTQKLLDTKKQEDQIRNKIESEFFPILQDETPTDDAIICKKCGTENPGDSLFCIACGEKFSISESESKSEDKNVK